MFTLERFGFPCIYPLLILYENDASEKELTTCLEYIKNYFIKNTEVFANDRINDLFPDSEVYAYLNLKNIASLIKFRFKLFQKYEEKQKKLIKKMDECLKKFKLEDKSFFSDFLNKDGLVEIPYPSLLLGHKIGHSEKETRISISELRKMSNELDFKKNIEIMFKRMVIDLSLLEIYFNTNNIIQLDSIITSVIKNLHTIDNSINKKDINHQLILFYILKFVIFIYSAQSMHLKWQVEKRQTSLERSYNAIIKAFDTELLLDNKLLMSDYIEAINKGKKQDIKYRKIFLILQILNKISAPVIQFVKSTIKNNLDKIKEQKITSSILEDIRSFIIEITSLKDEYLAKTFMICNHEEFIKKSQMLCTKIEKSKFLNLLSISNEEAWPNKEIDILEVLYLFIFYYEFENSENANINNPLVLNIIVKALQRMPR